MGQKVWQEQMSYQYFGIYFKEMRQTLNIGDTKQNEVVNETGRNLTWSSSNPQTVSIDNNGKMHVLKVGSAVITVTDGAEYSVSSNVRVTEDISKLKANKKYYVRIRTYKTVKVNGKSTKMYSSWSKAKSVTTKK